ncbi:hypothetical protein EDC04DRAFT_2622522 [Pisolithus marmoratus]|nr:hypothetical protein EDC04DRAFT_2622522 [Pisolithus marmoratus]
MLRAWKDASQGQPQRSHAKEQASCQDTQLRRTCSGEPSSVTADAASSNSGAILDSAQDGEDGVENAKKRKCGSDESMHPGSLSPPIPLVLCKTEDTHEQTRSRNTIVILDSFDDAIDYASHFLESAIIRTRLSSEVVSPAGKVSLFIVDESVSLESIARRLASGTRLKVTPWSQSISPARWSTLMEYQVVVSSIDALLEHLVKGVIKMSQLRVLVVFDMVTSICTSSTLMKVVECFYRTENADVQPSILALCSSARTTDTNELEQLLEAQVGSKSTMATFNSLRPLEAVVQYEPSSPLQDTMLTERIRAIQFSESLLSKSFSAAHCVIKELGPCACDLMWRRDMKQNALAVEDGGDEVAKVISELHNLFKSWTFSKPNVNLASRGFNVSPKFARLVQILNACELYGDKFRGIIFVQEREVAAVMVDMLCMVAQDLGFLRPLAITKLDDHDVQVMCRSFAVGKYNLLIIPRSLEDLDIPPALVIVRYDTYESQLSYAYSCARTAKAFGSLVHMVENGNDVERRRWIEVVASGGSSPIPPQPLIETCRLPDGPDESVGPYIEDPVTSGRLYERDAVCALYRFVSGTLRVSKTSHKSLFVVRQSICDAHSCEWICDVLLPPELFKEQISGPPRPTPAHARRAAAFIACVRLYEHGAFDHRLFIYPRLARKTQELARTDNISGNRCYPRRRTRFWLNSLRLFSHIWFPVILHVQGHEKHAPMLFTDHFHALHLFTIRICRAILNKPFACSGDDMVYLFAPLRSCVAGKLQSMELRRILDYVPWDDVLLAGKEWAVRFDSHFGPLQGVEDMVVQDRMVEFTRRYYALCLRRDLTPLSKPEDSPREAGYGSFVEYCKARRKGFESLQDYQQPMIEVTKITSVSNHLNPVFKPLAEPARAVAKCITFRTALLLPSVMRRIEDFLIVQELNAEFFNHSIDEGHLLAAISAPSAGYEVDYERLELFGDAFLKYLASIYVFVMNPSHLGALHAARQRIISNKALMESAVRSGLPQYIQGKPFSYKLWHPPNFTVDPFPGANAAGYETIGDENATSARASTNNLAAHTNVETQAGIFSRVQSRKKKSHDESIPQWLGDKVSSPSISRDALPIFLCIDNR